MKNEVEIELKLESKKFRRDLAELKNELEEFAVFRILNRKDVLCFMLGVYSALFVIVVALWLTLP